MKTYSAISPRIPHWPSVIDPVQSLVAAEVREDLAAQTKVIEKEYAELSAGQTFTSTPVSWLRPLSNPLPRDAALPIKAVMIVHSAVAGAWPK